MNEEMVMVKSMTKGIVGFNLPDLRLRKEWPKKGARLPVSKDILREAIYNPGVEYMFKNGILFIEDMDFKKELGLEPEDATEPENVIELDDKKMARYITFMPVADLRKEIEKLSSNQKKDLVDYAIEHNTELKMDRVTLINELCHTDLLKAIELKRKAEED